MACEDTALRTLHQAGLRLTRQRRTIIAALRHARGHATAQAVLEAVHAECPDISPSTIYRTLARFRDLGLVSQTDLGTGERSFAWLGDALHHHLICQRCGGVTEMGHDYLAPLQQRIKHDFGFEARIDHFALFGVCRACRAAPAGRSAHPADRVS